MKKTIGEKIRWLRLNRDCKQKELAAVLDISVAAFSKMETDLAEVNISRLMLIAAFFGVTPGSILDEEEPGMLKIDEDLNTLKDQLLLAEQRIVKLQGKLIDLYEERNA